MKLSLPFLAALSLVPCSSLDVRAPPQQVPEDQAAKSSEAAALLSEGLQTMASQAAVRMAASPASAPATSSGGFAFGEPVELVSEASCLKLSKATGAMSCRIVAEISGEPEGCECRLMGSTCPPASRALGFTGVSPSQALPVLKSPGQFVTLCMYWQWLDQPDRSKQVAEDKAETKRLANQYLRAGYDSVAEAVKPVSKMLAATTTFLGPEVSIDQVRDVLVERLFSTAPPTVPATAPKSQAAAVGKGLGSAAGKGGEAVAGLANNAEVMHKSMSNRTASARN